MTRWTAREIINITGNVCSYEIELGPSSVAVFNGPALCTSIYKTSMRSGR